MAVATAAPHTDPAPGVSSEARGLVALCEQVSDAVAALAGGDAAAGWSPAQVEAVMAAAVRARNSLDYLAGVAARTVGHNGTHRRTGDASEAHYLARVAGVGLGVARQALAVTAAVADLEATRAALAAGNLSMRQADAIAAAATVAPHHETRLLRIARARGVTQLEEECARRRASAAPDEEAERRRRAKAERRCRSRQNRDGSAQITFRSTPDDVAEAWATIAAFRDRILRDRRITQPCDRDPGGESGEGLGFDQAAADGFLDLCRTAAGATGRAVAEPTLPLQGLGEPRPVPVPKKIIVRVDLDTLVRGYPTDGETCDIPGVGPLPVEAVRDMLRTGNPFLAAVVTRSEQVIGVAHLGRVPTAHQQTVLEWLGARCAVEGCDRTVGLQRDHRTPWADTHTTVVDDMDWLCTPHHQLKTHHNWALVEGTGIRPFVPPHDPRHPDRGDSDGRASPANDPPGDPTAASRGDSAGRAASGP